MNKKSLANEVLLVQVIGAVFTAVLWWIARRDLAARVTPLAGPAAADTAELEQLCATLETLVTSLCPALEAVEAAAIPDAGAAEVLRPQPVIPGAEPADEDAQNFAFPRRMTVAASLFPRCRRTRAMRRCTRCWIRGVRPV